MIGFPLALNADQTAKVIAPAIITGSCFQLLGTSPDVTVDYVGPILLPAGDFHGPGSYISYVNAGGSWVGTAELVDFGGNVIATATINGSATEIIDGPGSVFHVPFDNNVNIPSDTLCYLRFTNTDSGAGVLTWYLEVVRAGALPIITTPPVVSWTVEIGNSPTLTDPVITGSFTHITWTLLRDGIEDDSINEVDKATAEAYVAQWSGDNTGVNDIGPDLSFRARAHSGAGSDVSVSNAVVFADATYLPDTAIGVSTAGLTLADSGTTVDAWASSFGSISATLTAPTSSQRPAYNATGGTGGRPLVTGDGTNDALTGTLTKGSAWDSYEWGAVCRLVSPGSAGNRVVCYGAGSTSRFHLNERNAGTFRVTVSGGANVEPLLDSSSARQHWSGDAASGTINARRGGTVEATASATVTSRPDGETLSLFADGAGGACSNSEMQAWYCGAHLTADQRTHLRALLTYHTGVSC